MKYHLYTAHEKINCEHVHLLYFQENYDNKGKEYTSGRTYFAWIKDLSRLCRSQVTNVADDKRYLITDSTHTLPWGHYSKMECT